MFPGTFYSQFYSQAFYSNFNPKLRTDGAGERPTQKDFEKIDLKKEILRKIDHFPPPKTKTKEELFADDYSHVKKKMDLEHAIRGSGDLTATGYNTYAYAGRDPDIRKR